VGGGQSEETGVRFYRPKPYMLLSSGDQGCEARVVYLPDPNEQYEITLDGAPSAEASVTLEDGWNLVAVSSRAKHDPPRSASAGAAPVKLVAEGIHEIEATALHVGLYELEITTAGVQPNKRRLLWDAGVECGQIE
jgi:hypothetical protein